MLDLLAPASSGLLALTKISIRRDGSVDNRLQAALDLAAPIESEDDAIVVEKMVPGALSLWRRSVEGSEDSARFGRSPSAMSVRAELAFAECEPPVEIDGRLASVSRVSVVVSARSRMFVARLTISGLDPDEIAALASALEHRGSVTTSTLQLDLFGVGPTSIAVRADLREVVSLRVEGASGPEYFFGAVTGEDDLSISVRDLDDQTPTVYDLSRCSVVSRLRIGASDTLLRGYRTLAASLGLLPTWGDLIVGLGAGYVAGASSSTPSAGASPTHAVWTLTRDHVRAALGGVELPEEAPEEAEEATCGTG
jgi:hypothetical protein